MPLGPPLTDWGPRRGYPGGRRDSDALAGRVNEGLSAMNTHQSRESHKGNSTNEKCDAERVEEKAGGVAAFVTL
jgi:hypothetical protein